ncbi:MAG: hypothetical protein GKR93_05850 [Gammaproteobacteria bacterium]|nr:hypothetical protein [Gammaproteobacteria bacterium]
MCLIAFSHRRSTAYPLVLIANRDESYERASVQAQFWDTDPDILAGRDLEKNGSWLGINRRGRFAAVTNFREGLSDKKALRSRGLLVSEFLRNDASFSSYIESCQAEAENYGGFNLLLGDENGIYYLSNRDSHHRKLGYGVYAVSNAEIDSDWPKVSAAREQLDDVVQNAGVIDHIELLNILANREVAIDEQLPDTNIGIDWERKLSPMFIKTEDYGTRVSTVITIDNSAEVMFTERTYDREGAVENENRYTFRIQRSR